MRASTLITLAIPSLATAAFHPVFNNHADTRHIAIANPAAAPEAPAAPTNVLNPLSNREVVAAPPAAVPTGGISQVPTVTTQWVQTMTNGVLTYVEVIYTQKFAEVPLQGADPGAGAIGLGTITGAIGAARTADAQEGAAGSITMVGWRAMLGLGAAMGVGAGLILL